MHIVRYSRRENVECETNARIAYDFVAVSEERLCDLYTAFSEYTRKMSSLRDKGDSIAVSVNCYSVKESISSKVKETFRELAEVLATVEDHREAQIRRLEKKVINDLSQYNSLCREVKSDLRNVYNAQEKESNRRRQLDKAKEKSPNNMEKISKAEVELSQSLAKATRLQRELQDRLEVFERRKHQNLKNILKEFVLSELAFHAKAVELYTNAYNCVKKLDDIDSAEDLKNHLNGLKIASRLDTVKSTSQKHLRFDLKETEDMYGTPNETLKVSAFKGEDDRYHEEESSSEETENDNNSTTRESSYIT